MQNKRSVLQSGPDENAEEPLHKSRKRARRGSQETLEVDTEFEGIRRRFASALFVSPGVLVFCPSLSNVRPYPVLLTKSITPKLPSPSQYPILNTNLDKTHSLPLPREIINALPYSYAQPTILSRSHDPRYFLAFFPKLSDETRRRLGQRAAASAHLATMATNQAVQDIVNGADPALATAIIPSPNDFASQGYDTEVEEYEDLGGVLVLYTRPEPSPIRITYSHTFDVYASWKTDYCAMECSWLFPPRKWIAEDENDETASETKQGENVGKMTSIKAENGAAGLKSNGVKQEAAMNGIFGETRSEEAANKLEEDDSASNWKPPRLRRTPVVGPVQPTYSSTNSTPTFVVLYADHRLNLYFSALPTFPTPSGTRPSDPMLPNSVIPVYPKLDVISCPILTPSVVLYESTETPTAPAPNTVKQENGKPDSSAASSPEQPLLQQQQQQILQQQQQGTVGEVPENDTAVIMQLNPTETPTDTQRKVRQIRPGQAVIYMREEDETIWVAFRSYRPTRLLVPVDRVSVDTAEAANATAQNGIGKSTGFGKSPANTGISNEVVNLLNSMPRNRGPNELSVEALATIGVMRDASGVASGSQLPPLGSSTDYANAMQAARVLDAESVCGLEGEEEDWICVTELRLDLLSGIPSVSARPIPQINFPYASNDIRLYQSRLLDFCFLENIAPQADSMDEPALDEDEIHLAREGRDLELVMCFAQRNQTTPTSCNDLRLEHIRLCRRELDVSDAFSLLSPPEKSERKPDIKDLSRLEWISAEIGKMSLPTKSTSVPRGFHRENGASIYFSTSNGRKSRLAKISLAGHGLEIKETDTVLETGYEVLDRSLNYSMMVASSSTGELLILPLQTRSEPVSDRSSELAQAFALAIVNATAYDDLLRRYQPDIQKMNVSSLDTMLSRVWSILQSFDCSHVSQNDDNDWLVPYLEFATIVFRLTMDDRVHTSTLLLHLISTENLFFRCRVDDFTGKVDDKGHQRTRTYETESAWLLLSHLEWYLQLVRTIVFRSILSAETEASEHSVAFAAQHAAIDFILSHPAALALLQAICTEMRGFALKVSNETVPAAPYPGSSQIALIRDAASTSLLQNILRDQVEGLGIRVSEWQRILGQLSRSQEEHSSYDVAELVRVRLLPTRRSGIEETLQSISSNTNIVVSQLELFGSGNRMPDFFVGRDLLSKDTFPDAEMPGRQYCQCCICHGIGSLWHYPSVRGYGTESMAAQWMSQWSARCICGGSWV